MAAATTAASSKPFSISASAAARALSARGRNPERVQLCTPDSTHSHPHRCVMHVNTTSVMQLGNGYCITSVASLLSSPSIPRRPFVPVFPTGPASSFAFANTRITLFLFSRESSHAVQPRQCIMLSPTSARGMTFRRPVTPTSSGDPLLHEVEHLEPHTSHEVEPFDAHEASPA